MIELPDDAHAYGCSCERCRILFAVLNAKLPNGEYAFTDEEFKKLALADHPQA